MPRAPLAAVSPSLFHRASRNAALSSARFCAPIRWTIPMTFKYTYTFPISGPNKLPRFRKWAEEHAPEIAVSLPPQVPAKSEAMTVRLKSPEDRAMLVNRMSDSRI